MARGIDPVDLAAGMAALQLLPANADRLLRLEAGAGLAASLTPTPGQRPSTRDDLDALVHRSTLGAPPFARLEDPHEGLFTDSILFDGGDYVVFPGMDRAAVFNFRVLAAGLFGGPEYPDRDFAQLARITLWAGLRVADGVAARAGLRRGMVPVPSDDRTVVLPDPAELARLKAAVRFTTPEMTAALAGNPPIVLGRLLSTYGTPLTDPADPALRVHPVLVLAGEYVVAAPHELVTAAMHAVLGLASERGQSDELGRRVRAAVNERVAEALERMRIRPRLSGDSWNAPAGPLASLWKLDTDKRLSAFVIADDLDGYHAAMPFADWDGADALVRIAGKREREIEAFVCGQEPIPNAIFNVYALQGFRPYSAGLDASIPPLESTRLVLSAADLELLSYLERGEPLALLKFAQAGEELRRRTRVMTHDPLAEYAVYRGSHSFYFDDTALPNAMGFAFEGVSPLYGEVACRIDVHGARLPGDGGWTEVARLQPDAETPLYAPTHRIDDVVRNYVERGPGFWITVSVAEASERVVDLALIAAESMAYWTSQIYPWIAEATTLASAGQQPIEVRVILPGEEWFEETNEAMGLPESQVVAGRVEITLHPSFRSALMRSDNIGERELVRALARGARDLAAARDGGVADEDSASIDACVDAHAPLGTKKYFLQIDVRQNLALLDEHLPRLRLLQEADDAAVLDAVGPAVAQAQGRPIGPVSPDDALPVLRSAVSWALDQLGRELAVLSAEEALPWFVAQYERLIQAQARDRLAAPTQPACFGDTPAVRERINRAADDYVHTALALRTVIEHVTARPPHGIRPMSLEVHDRVLALANEAIKRAYAYDGMKYELHDLKVSILTSGRLGMSRGGALETARDRFAPIYAAAEVDRSVKGFASHWDVGSGEATRAALAELDPAATVEFGFSITELATLLAETSALGLELPAAAKLIPLDQLVATLAERLGWPPERVARAVDFFSLRQRDDFLTPPPGYNANDVFPWRFNRQLSYARRPLLIRETGAGPQVVFGLRQAFESAEYLYDLCTSARLRAQTRPMQLAIGTIRDKQTRAFVTRVADHFRAIDGTTVATGVKKVGGRRIARSSSAVLGDIDVLVIAPAERKILSIEVKDLAVARTPNELERQLQDIFVTCGDRPARAAVHLERTEYLRAHVPELLADMGIADDGLPWTVEPLMVTGRELLTHHLAESPVPVISFRELIERKAAALTASLTE